MSHQTCQVSVDSLDHFKKLRFRKEKSIAALILKIDPKELVVIVDNYLENVTIEDLVEELPESSPRFLVISIELKHKDGRISYPLAGIYYNPEGSSTTNRMMYASSTNSVFTEAGITGKVFDLSDPEAFTEAWLIEKLEASKTRP